LFADIDRRLKGVRRTNIHAGRPELSFGSHAADALYSHPLGDQQGRGHRAGRDCTGQPPQEVPVGYAAAAFDVGRQRLGRCPRW
jgi:hypothetical protein